MVADPRPRQVRQQALDGPPLGALPEVGRKAAVIGVENSHRLRIELGQPADLYPLDARRDVQVRRVRARSDGGRRLVALGQQRGRRRQLDRLPRRRQRNPERLLHRGSLFGDLRLNRRNHPARKGKAGEIP